MATTRDEQGMEKNAGSMTEPQRKKLFAEMAEVKLSKEELETSLGFHISELSVSEASALIDYFVKGGKSLTATIAEVKAMHSGLPPAQGQAETEQKKQEFFDPREKMETEEKPLPKEMEKKAVLKTEKASDRISVMAHMQGIPVELANMYFMIIDDQLYIKAPGLLHLAAKKGYTKIEVQSEKQGDGYTATARIYPKMDVEFIRSLNGLPEDVIKEIVDKQYGPTSGYASANKSNVRNTRMHVFLKELAETRAVNRALRLYTGYGGTSYEEMPQAEVIEE